jgi:hypothetical protein
MGFGGLKPVFCVVLCGTAEAVPFPERFMGHLLLVVL